MGITISGTVQWEAWQAKLLPPVERLRSYLWSIPVPMPRNPLRYVNIYAFAVDDGVVLIDTGWPEEESFDALRRGLAEAGYTIEQVRRIVITHAHMDHYGLAQRVQEISGATIAVHEQELAFIESAAGTGDAGEMRELLIDHLVEMGVPQDRAHEGVGDADDWARFPAMPAPDVLLADGDLAIPEHGVRAVWAPGHTRGHTCYLIEDEHLLISGDHLLPRVSPNITTWKIGGDVPLAQYFDSLQKVRELDVAEVLPAHEYRFIGHQDRVDQLRAHHVERLGEIEAVVRSDDRASTWDIANRLTWSRPFETLDPRQWSFALGETLSHLDYLREGGTVDYEEDSVQRWRIA